MRSLVEFLLENMEFPKISLKESAADSKEMPQEMTFTFDFTEFPKAKETVEAVQNCASEAGLKVDFNDEKNILTLSLTRSQCDNNEADEVLNILREYATELRKDQKNSSREYYAQLTKKFKLEVDKMNEFIDFVPDNEEE